MKRPVRLALIIFLAALVAACASGSSAQSLTAADAGKTIQLRSGEEFRVVLDGNPTTGYTWQPAADSTAPAALVGEIGFKPDSNAIGSGGKQTLTFKAGSPGEGTLKLEYRQPWELDAPPADTFEVQVVVK